MRSVRRNDCWPDGAGPPGAPDLASALGTWFNCNPHTGEISLLTLAERDGGLVLRAFGVGGSGPIDWGETSAIPHASDLTSRTVSGFVATYDFTFMETHLAANIKYGVLVIQSYNRFRDASRRPPYFTREFFHQDLIQSPPPAASGVATTSLSCRMTSDRPPAGPGRSNSTVDLTSVLGRWHNTYRHSRGIRAVELTSQAGQYYLHASGVGSDADWGQVPVIPHATEVSGLEPAGFLARYDFGFSELTLAANEAKGLLIIAAFSTFRDGSGRASYFTREFFYREPDGRRSS
jgi:hypothetical protein